MLKSKKYSIMV